jgi:hypothetical protein
MKYIRAASDAEISAERKWQRRTIVIGAVSAHHHPGAAVGGEAVPDLRGRGAGRVAERARAVRAVAVVVEKAPQAGLTVIAVPSVWSCGGALKS